MRPIPGSLERRLVALLVLAVALFGVTAAKQSAEVARHEAEELFDAQLAQAGQSLLAIGDAYGLGRNGELGHDPIQPPKTPAHRYQSELIFQLWQRGDPEVLLRSIDAPQLLIAPLPPNGFSYGSWEGRTMRFFRETRGSLEVLVGETDKARDEVSSEVVAESLAPYLFGLPLLALIAIILVRLSLRPLRNLAKEVDSRSADHLRPLATTQLPRELLPLAERINRLLVRLATAFDNERRFTADAAHELRTPLAALRAQAESALLAGEPEALRQGLKRVLHGGHRLEHLVGQLLTLARLEGAGTRVTLVPTDLGRLAEEVCAEVGVMAIAKGQELSLLRDGAAPVVGRPELLGALLRNLIDNAVRYTPAGGEITVTISATEHLICCTVCDGGPGVPEEELARIGARFHRLNPTIEGAGLGLSIARRIAELHDAQLQFANRPEGGLCATVTLPQDLLHPRTA